jgi:hypothetical protein
MARFATALVFAVMFSLVCPAGAPAQTAPRQGRLLRDAPLRAAPESFARITGRLAANSTVLVLVQGAWCGVLALDETGPAQTVGYVACGDLVLHPAGARRAGWKVVRREEGPNGEERLSVELASDRAPSREELATVLAAAAAGESSGGEPIELEAYLPSMDKDEPGFAKARFEGGRLSELIVRKSVLMLYQSSQP